MNQLHLVCGLILLLYWLLFNVKFLKISLRYLQEVYPKGAFTHDQKQTGNNSSDHQMMIDPNAVAGLKFAMFSTAHLNKSRMFKFHSMKNFFASKVCNLHSCYCRFNALLLWCPHHILLPEMQLFSTLNYGDIVDRSCGSSLCALAHVTRHLVD